MIRINLLPVRAKAKEEAGQKQLIFFVLLVVAAGIGNYFWYSSVKTDSDKLHAEVQGIEKEIADLNRIIGEVQNYDKENKALEDKLKVLDTLKRGRTGPVKMLDAMATSIPKNVWLRKLEEKGGAMTLEGAALSNDDLAEFMKALSNSVWTVEGMGRLVETGRKDKNTRVELIPSGQIKDLPVEQIGNFFRDIKLRKAELKGTGDNKTVDFSLSLSANFAI
jgi:type IV pilus assembly protein PilN